MGPPVRVSPRIVISSSQQVGARVPWFDSRLVKQARLPRRRFNVVAAVGAKHFENHQFACELLARLRKIRDLGLVKTVSLQV